MRSLSKPSWIRLSLSERSPDEPSGTRRTAAILPAGGAIATAVFGMALGLGATELVVARGWDPGAVAVGPWVARPQVGSVSIDPYARADLARNGEVPLAANEGLTFTATTDDTGYRLVRNCFYRVAGLAPTARAWTLTAGAVNARSIVDPSRRSAFTSAEVVRDIDGYFTIMVGPNARPGNWLSVAGDGLLTLSLRLYDTPLAGNPGEVATASLPSITRQSCEAASGGGTARSEAAT